MKNFIALTLCLVLILTTGCGTTAENIPTSDPMQTTETYVWKVAFLSNEESSLYAGIQKFQEEIYKRVGDQVTIEIYLNGQLGSSTDQTIGGLQARTIDFCEATLGNVAEYTTAFMPTNLPYLFLDREIAFELVDGETGEKMKDKYEQDAGIKLLCYWENGYRELTNSKREITTPEDCAGLKIRTMSNPIHMAGMTALGINPTPMSWSEMLTALQQKTVDGQENPISMIYEQKIYELQDYVTMTDHFFDFTGLHMSADYYNSLPDHIRTAIDEAAEIAEQYQREIMAEREAAALQQLKDTGEIQVTELSYEQKEAFQNAAKTSWTQIGESCPQEWTDMIITAVEDIQASYH